MTDYIIIFLLLAIWFQGTEISRKISARFSLWVNLFVKKIRKLVHPK